MTNSIKQYKNGNSQSSIEHIRAVRDNLGVKCAAGMARNKGWSLEAALFILLGK